MVKGEYGILSMYISTVAVIAMATNDTVRANIYRYWRPYGTFEQISTLNKPITWSIWNGCSETILSTSIIMFLIDRNDTYTFQPHIHIYKLCIACNSSFILIKTHAVFNLHHARRIYTQSIFVVWRKIYIGTRCILDLLWKQNKHSYSMEKSHKIE